ncbi:hypothetical protein [Streptomyces sp. NPDC054962]
MLELNAHLVGSVSGGKSVLAALLQTLAARPVAHDAQVWLVDACSGNDAHTDTFTLQQALDALNDHYGLPNRVSHVRGQCPQAADEQPKSLWISTEHNSNWRSACLPAGQNAQDLDILTEIIAYARPFAGRTFADDVRCTLSTLRAEFSRSSRLSHRETPWVRFLDFTWPAPVVGRSLADLLQHQAPEVADAWRLWSRDHNIELNGHMAGVWKHTSPRHDVTGSAVFVLLSADTCRTLTVPPPAAQHRLGQPDVELRRPRPSELQDGLRPSTGQDRDRTVDDGELPSGKKQSPRAATGERTTAESDMPPHLSRHIDDFLTPVTIRGRAEQESWADREHRRVDPPNTREAVAPVLDADTVRAIKAYEPGEDTLPDIERLLLSAAS